VPREEIFSYLALFSSRAFRFLVTLSLGLAAAGRKNYDVGIIQRTPVPDLAHSAIALATLARRAWSLKRHNDMTEASHAFTLPVLLQMKSETLATRTAEYVEESHTIEAELTKIQAEIDETCFRLYGIDEADRHGIDESFSGNTSSAESIEAETDVELDEEGHEERNFDATSLVADLASWAVGIAFGRFDVRLATGAREAPPEPEPFDPLPVCSPAMLTDDHGLPLASAPGGYPLTFPENGILMDDPGHPHDLTTIVHAVFNEVFGTSADARWDEAATLLDPSGHSLRAWLASSFFEHHLKRYSKSRRKAPILWQLGTPSGCYSVWLYAHRITRDSFFQIQNDVVGPKLAHEERQLASIMQTMGGSPSAKERKEIAAQETFVQELRTMLDEVKRVTPLWNPRLDDGVVLTMAPLWRLVPQHKPWQKELKTKWNELAGGKYDWAHIAMHLWPERVVPKCATDRSLAIAHDLEDVFWVENPTGKWTQRPKPAKSVEELVRERTSPAVKAALRSLLDTSQAPDGQKAARHRASPRARRT
jgi:hypothetical protein